VIMLLVLTQYFPDTLDILPRFFQRSALIF
jgi:hypothetical protein